MNIELRIEDTQPFIPEKLIGVEIYRDDINILPDTKNPIPLLTQVKYIHAGREITSHYRRGKWIEISENLYRLQLFDLIDY